MALIRAIMPSAARTATPTAEIKDKNNPKYRGVRVHIKTTAVTSTPSVVFTIQGKDTLTNTYYDLLASAAVTATGETYLTVYPGLTAAANSVASNVLPSTFRVNAVHGNANSITYQVTADLLD